MKSDSCWKSHRLDRLVASAPAALVFRSVAHVTHSVYVTGVHPGREFASIGTDLRLREVQCEHVELSKETESQPQVFFAVVLTCFHSWQGSALFNIISLSSYPTSALVPCIPSSISLESPSAAPLSNSSASQCNLLAFPCLHPAQHTFLSSTASTGSPVSFNAHRFQPLPAHHKQPAARPKRPIPPVHSSLSPGRLVHPSIWQNVVTFFLLELIQVLTNIVEDGLHRDLLSHNDVDRSGYVFTDLQELIDFVCSNRVL